MRDFWPKVSEFYSKLSCNSKTFLELRSQDPPVFAGTADTAAVETDRGVETGSSSSDEEGLTFTSGVTGTATFESVTVLEAATETVVVEIASGEIDDEGIVVETTTLGILVDFKFV